MVKANTSKQNSHMEVSIHVGVIVVRTQFFVLIYEFILTSPNNYMYILITIIIISTGFLMV